MHSMPDGASVTVTRGAVSLTFASGAGSEAGAGVAKEKRDLTAAKSSCQPIPQGVVLPEHSCQAGALAVLSKIRWPFAGHLKPHQVPIEARYRVPLRCQSPSLVSICQLKLDILSVPSLAQHRARFCFVNQIEFHIVHRRILNMVLEANSDCPETSVDELYGCNPVVEECSQNCISGHCRYQKALARSVLTFALWSMGAHTMVLPRNRQDRRYWPDRL